MFYCAMTVLAALQFNTATPTNTNFQLDTTSCPGATGFVPTNIVIRAAAMSATVNQCVQVNIVGTSPAPAFIVVQAKVSDGAPGQGKFINFNEALAIQSYNSINPNNVLNLTVSNCQGGGPDTTGIVELTGYGTYYPGTQPPY